MPVINPTEDEVEIVYDYISNLSDDEGFPGHEELEKFRKRLYRAKKRMSDLERENDGKEDT